MRFCESMFAMRLRPMPNFTSRVLIDATTFDTWRVGGWIVLRMSHVVMASMIIFD